MHESPMASHPIQAQLIQAIERHQAGQMAEAEGLYQGILAAMPHLAAASYGIGLLRAAEGRLQEAIDAYSHAIHLRPDYIEAHVNLGNTLLMAGFADQALLVLRKAVAISPENGVVLGSLAKTLHDLGQLEDAVALYQQAVACQPDNAPVWSNLGAALVQQQAWQDSVVASRQAIALVADNPIAYGNLATALLNLGQHEDAAEAGRQAVALLPTNARLLASVGGVMLEVGAWEEAAVFCGRATRLDGSRPEAFFNLSHACKALNWLEEAAEAARRAIALCPDFATYHFHLAHILLLQGKFEAGWAEYDWRWKLPDFAWLEQTYGRFSQPLWTGQDISDKTILIYTEQGLGDIVQFARYIPLVRQKAGRVIVVAFPNVRKLLACIDGIEIITLRQDSLPAFDVHCPLLTLPRVFGTHADSIPAAIPYLHPAKGSAADWTGRLGREGLRVGIVWAGNPVTRRDRFRSPGLGSVLPLFAIPGVQFVVLQKGPGRQDCETWPLPPHVIDLGPEIEDLTDTAAIMSELDLVITSCTGPLHLAGALGVRTWAMIPFAPHFPWRLERTDSDWYPTLRLYRQDRPGQDWSGVVARIAADLSALVEQTRVPALEPAAALAMDCA